MRMTFGEAFRLVLNQLGLSVLWIQLGIWIGLVLITLMGFGSIFLSAWGLEWITATFLVFYLIIVLGVIYSPITWGGISGTAVIAGQPGGEENLSLNDGIDVLKRWAPIALDKMSLMLIFWVPAWFLYTILFSTKGHVQENMLLFILIPTLIYFAKDEWPTGKLVLRIAGYLLVAIAVYVVGATVFGTVERKVADPAAQEAMEHEDKEAEAKKENDLAVAQYIYGQIDRKVPLTPDEEVILARLEKKKVEQSLRPKDWKTKVENFIGEAKPTDSAWWKTYWPLIGAIAIGLVIAWRYGLFGRTANQVIVVTPTTAGTVAPAVITARTTKSWGLWGVMWRLSLLALVVGLAYAWHTDKIFYQKTVTLEKTDLRDFEICGISPGTRTWKPAQRAIVALTQKMPGGSEIVNQKYEITLFLLMNDTVAGEPFQVKEGECVKGSFALSKDARQDIRFLPQHIALTFYSALW